MEFIGCDLEDYVKILEEKGLDVDKINAYLESIIVVTYQRQPGQA